MLVLIAAAIFYLFCFFLPALQIKYEGISTLLASELHFTESKIPVPDADFSKTAVIVQEDTTELEKRLIYTGDKNCRLFHEIYSSEYSLPKVCIGFGDCISVCPQQAIRTNGKKVEITPLCNGCGKCVDYCPVNIISLVPRAKKSEENSEKGFKFWTAWYKLFSVVSGR